MRTFSVPPGMSLSADDHGMAFTWPTTPAFRDSERSRTDTPTARPAPARYASPVAAVTIRLSAAEPILRVFSATVLFGNKEAQPRQVSEIGAIQGHQRVTAFNGLSGDPQIVMPGPRGTTQLPR